MSRSFGAGSPVFFKCAAAARSFGRYYPEDHVVRRTGRTKPRPHGGALGARNLHTYHEYVCSCGYVGWTTHVDILRRPLVDDAPEGTVDWGKPHVFVEARSRIVCGCGRHKFDELDHLPQE